MERMVTVIPVKRELTRTEEMPKIRVAAYARVSKESSEQEERFDLRK